MRRGPRAGSRIAPRRSGLRVPLAPLEEVPAKSQVLGWSRQAVAGPRSPKISACAHLCPLNGREWLSRGSGAGVDGGAVEAVSYRRASGRGREGEGSPRISQLERLRSLSAPHRSDCARLAALSTCGAPTCAGLARKERDAFRPRKGVHPPRHGRSLGKGSRAPEARHRNRCGGRVAMLSAPATP